MTRQGDPRKPGERLLPVLDDEPGPMPPLSAAESDAVAWAAVSRWAAHPPGLEPADDDHGPSRPLTPQAAEHLAASALRLHARKQQAAAPERATWALRAAAAVLSMAAVAGISYAALRLWPLPFEAGSSQPAGHAPQLAASAAQPSAAPAAQDPPVAHVEPSAQLDPKPASTLDPELLLARANALRAKRRWSAAESTYRQVITAESSAQQRYVALVAAAAIALQHLHKPTRALGLYQSARALNPNGMLSEEVLFGTAECYRALGNPQAELRTLRELSADLPESLRVETARRRIAELEAAETR